MDQKISNKIVLWTRVGCFLSMMFFVFIWVAEAATTTVPRLMNYQGKLNDSSGAPVSGTKSIIFSLYTSATDTVTPALWTETQDVTAANGAFSAVLGSQAALPQSVFNNAEVWLGIAVGGDPEMTPRQQITSVGYAQRAATADNVSSSNVIVSTMPTGTAPFTVASTTMVANLNAQMVGGKLASDLVSKAGDTMTGSLNLPSSGLAVGTNQLVVAAGNVGIGTATPQAKLDIKGDFKLRPKEYVYQIYSDGNIYAGCPSPRCACDINTTNAECSAAGGVYYSDTNYGNNCYDCYYSWGGGYVAYHLYTRSTSSALLQADSTGLTLGAAGQNVQISQGDLILKDARANSPGSIHFKNSADTIYGRIIANSSGFDLGKDEWTTAVHIAAANNYVGIGKQTPTAELDVAGNVRITDKDIYFRSDTNHGVGWYGGSKTFSGSAVDGAVLYGNSGGVLGSTGSGGQKIALQWNSNQNVSIPVSLNTGTVSVSGIVRINDNDIYLRTGSDTWHGLGWYGAGKNFASTNVNGPALYGNSGGVLGTIDGLGQKIALRWDSSQNVAISGNLSKGSGSFKIDHPLDPKNKYLYHSFVESPDMMNIYNGNVTTDENGYATITLPEWFEALNRDFRYQLTVIGTDSWARARVAEEVRENRFIIQTDISNTKVSWQVTGIRKDAYAEAHRIPVEEEKTAPEKGTCLHEEACRSNNEN